MSEVEQDCELCLNPNGNYELGRVCCCVRLILAEPRKDVRRALLDRWKQKNSTLAERVEREVKARWKKP